MKARLLLVSLLSLLGLAVSRADIVNVARLFADAYAMEDFILVDDTSKIDELKTIQIISRDGHYREDHGISHIYDGRSIHLSEKLRRDFLSGARIFQAE